MGEMQHWAQQNSAPASSRVMSLERRSLPHPITTIMQEPLTEVQMMGEYWGIANVGGDVGTEKLQVGVQDRAQVQEC